MIRFNCPSCQKSLSAPDDKAGLRFACPGCRQPVEVPRAAAGAIATQPTLLSGRNDGEPVSVGKRVADECLAIAVATFRQTLKPITYVFEVMRRYRLQKKSHEARLVLAQRLYENKLGDARLRGRIQALGERIHGIQDVKGDARAAIAERKGLLLQLADPVLNSERAPDVVESEHEQARSLTVKLKAQEQALAGALGGMLPPNAEAWRRVVAGYSVALVVLFGTVYTFGIFPFNREEPIPMMVLVQQRKEQEDANWSAKRDSEQIVEKCGPSVALIRYKMGKREGGGTGFMIRPGLVATNAHVIDSALADQLKVYFPSAGEDMKKKPHTAQVVYFDRKRDLAFLSVDANVPPLRLAEKFEFKGGRSITIIGCPGMGETQLENAVNTGVLSTQTDVEGVPYYQLGAPVNPGNSGGPVFDDRGQVIGVVTLKAAFQESLSFCIPWKDLKERLEALEREDPHKVAMAAQAMHNLHVVVDRVENSCLIYGRIMQAYAFAMQSAQERGRPPIEGVNEQRLKVDEFIGRVGPFMIDDKLYALGQKLLTDPNIPADARAKFDSLWKTYLEMRTHFEKPSGTGASYMVAQQKLMHQFQQQFEAMRVALGFEERRRDDDDF